MGNVFKWIALKAAKAAIFFAIGIVAGLAFKYIFDSPDNNFPDADAFAAKFARAMLERDYSQYRSMCFDGDADDMRSLEEGYMQGWTNIQARLDEKYFLNGARRYDKIDSALGSMRNSGIRFYRGKPATCYDFYLGLSDDPEGDWRILVTSDKGNLKIVKQYFD